MLAETAGKEAQRMMDLSTYSEIRSVNTDARSRRKLLALTSETKGHLHGGGDP